MTQSSKHSDYVTFCETEYGMKPERVVAARICATFEAEIRELFELSEKKHYVTSTDFLPNQVSKQLRAAGVLQLGKPRVDLDLFNKLLSAPCNTGVYDTNKHNPIDKTKLLKLEKEAEKPLIVKVNPISELRENKSREKVEPEEEKHEVDTKVNEETNINKITPEDLDRFEINTVGAFLNRGGVSQ